MEEISKTLMHSLSIPRESESLLNKKCPKCGENLYKKYMIFNREATVRVMCSCEIKAKEEREHKKLMMGKQERVEKLIKNSLIDDKFRNSKFENWDFSKGSKQMYELGTRYADNFKACKEKGIGMLIYGIPGNGKTYLSSCIANKLIENYIPVISVSVIRMLDRIKETFKKYGSEAEEDVIRGLKNADLLILDDLGTEPHTDWSVSTIYSIIDGRYRQGLPLLVTTNLDMKNNTTNSILSKIYGKRTEDRILEMCTPVENKASSIRLQNAKRNTDIIKELLFKGE